jgi:hypothetical protein
MSDQINNNVDYEIDDEDQQFEYLVDQLREWYIIIIITSSSSSLLLSLLQKV